MVNTLNFVGRALVVKCEQHSFIIVHLFSPVKLNLVVNTTASYFGGPGLKFPTRDQLSH
jgi:hypothetical protein